MASHRSQLVSPAVTSTRPSGSVVVVGYQRWVAIAPTFVHLLIPGSKRFVSLTPVCPAAWPPATRICPSAKAQWPEQNMLVRLFGTEVKMPGFAGFQRRASFPFPWPSHARICPVGSRAACTATMGQVTEADHWPTRDAVAAATVTETGALVVELPAKSRATAVRLWLPGETLVVSQRTEYGALVTSAPRGTLLSRRNCTPAMPTLSDTTTETETRPETVAPALGALIATVG